jgi:fatty acid synthase subunit alpha
MQRAVERDSEDHSNYAMCAVNRSRMSKTSTDATLREVVDTITVPTDSLEIIDSLDDEFDHAGSSPDS